MADTYFFRCYNSVQLGMSVQLQLWSYNSQHFKNFKDAFYCCNHTANTYPEYTFQSSSWKSQRRRKCTFTEGTENENWLL